MNHNIVVLIGWIVGIIFLAVPLVVGIGIYLTDQKNKVKVPKEDKVKSEKKSIFAREDKEKRSATSLIAKKSDISKETQVASVFGEGGSGFTLPSSEERVTPPAFANPSIPRPIKQESTQEPDGKPAQVNRPLLPPPSLR